MTLLDEALAYAADNWPVFPCRPDKTPYVNQGWYTATTDTKQIKEWWAKWPHANIGWKPDTCGYAVVDLDPGWSMEEIIERTGAPLPPTSLKVKTPRGEHWYYQVPKGEVVPDSIGKIAPHVDVRSNKGYVLLPPSQTAHGVYKWSGDGEGAYIPKDFLKVLQAQMGRDKHPDAHNWIIEPDMADNVELARKWLLGETAIRGSFCSLAIQGQHGDATTYATAGMMHSCGLSELMALDLMWEHWSGRCSPPWGYDELAAKVRNAYAYATSPPGNVTNAYTVAKQQQMFEPIQRTISEDDPTGRPSQLVGTYFRAMNRSAMNEVPNPSWLIEGLLMRNTQALMIGDPGTYKTFLALDIAATIASGISPFSYPNDWKGMWKCINPGPVLFAAGEGFQGLKHRLSAWEKEVYGGKSISNDLVLMNPVPHIEDNDEAFMEFIEMAKEMSPAGNYRLVVLDTVSRTMAGTNENSSETVTAYIKMVERVRQTLDCTVMGLHHFGHADKTRGRGSSAFLGNIDTQILIHKKDKFKLSMQVTKQKDGDEWEEPRFVDMRKVGVTDRFDSLVPQWGKGVTPKEKEIKQEIAEKSVLDKVEEVYLDILRSNPMKQFSDSGIAKEAEYWKKDGETQAYIGLGWRPIQARADIILRERSSFDKWYKPSEPKPWCYKKGS